MQEAVQHIAEVVEQMQQTAIQPVQTVAPVQQAMPQEAPVQTIVQTPVFNKKMSEERRIHENYLRLISEPINEPDETPTVPLSENIDTEKLIYNNKPETERDYKNLINNLLKP